ncbi:hypothetical protein ABK040_016639 [Willaertia magna]
MTINNNHYHANNNSANNHNNNKRFITSSLLIQIAKVFIAALFFFSASCTNVFVTVFIIGDRININTEPSADILFDLFPEKVPHAFAIAEICTVSLVILLIGTVILNNFQEKINILFRFFLLIGFLLYLRALCIAITVFPVPSVILQAKCQNFIDKVRLSKVNLFLQLVLGAGTSGMNENISTCGDYVFSGHTLTLTIISFFIRKYLATLYTNTNRWLSLTIRIIAHLLNFIGMTFIIVSREHYSVDVVLGYFLTIVVCQYYHSLVFISTSRSNDHHYVFDHYHPYREDLLFVPFFKNLENSNEDVVVYDMIHYNHHEKDLS